MSLRSYLTQPTECISERKVITDLLLRYKQHPCLWDTSDALYSSKTAKRDALADLNEIYKLLEKDCNTISLKKKIEHMRTSYKREYKKVLNNKNHRPVLWYYNLLSFLNETSTRNSAEGDGIQSEELECNDEVSGATESFVFEFQGTDSADVLKVESPVPKPTRPKKIKQSFIDSDYEQTSIVVRPDDSTEAGAFGRTLGLQLSELNAKQKIIAQKLISDVIFYGRLNKLTTQTSFVNLKGSYDDDDSC